jgi:hypothetical protein
MRSSAGMKRHHARVPTIRAPLWLIAALLLSAPCTPAEDDATACFPVRVGRGMGYIDRTGRLTIPPRFRSAYPFSEGLAAVTDLDDEHSKFGFIDRAGKLVIPGRYEQTQPFSDGIAWVSVTKDEEEQWTAIDRHGNELFAPRPYVAIFDFHDGIAAVDTGKSLMLVNTSGETLFTDRGDFFLPPSEGLIAFNQLGSSRWGFLDRDGNVVIPPEFSDVEQFSGGLAAVRTGGELAPSPQQPTLILLQGGTLSLIDRSGKAVFSMPATRESDRISAPKDGRAYFSRDGKCGFLDEHGRVVIDNQFEAAWDFNERRAAVKRDGKWGFIDTDGRVVVPFRYSQVDSYHDGMARVWTCGDPALAGYVDAEGNEAVPPKYSRAQPSFEHGLAQVGLGPGPESGYVDTSGRLVWKDVMPPADAKE